MEALIAANKKVTNPSPRGDIIQVGVVEHRACDSFGQSSVLVGLEWPNRVFRLRLGFRPKMFGTYHCTFHDQTSATSVLTWPL